MISIKDLKNIKDLIKQAIKIDNWLYQSDKVQKGPEKVLVLYKMQITH
jgi:hypothetical protein